MLTERKLTERELESRKAVIQGLLNNKQNLVKKYGKDAEKVMYGIATKKAKSKVEEMNKEKIRELIYKALTREDNDPSGADLEGDPNEYVVGEGHGLDQGDIDILKNLISQLKDGGDLRLDVGGRKSFIRVLNFIIKSNILQDKTKDLSKGKVDEIGVGVVQDPAIYEAFLTIIGILGAGAGAAKTAEYLSNNADKVIDWVADNAPKYLDKVKDYISKKVKLTENALNEFLQGDLKKRNEVLFDKLVPNSGASKFAEGEMIRALNRLIYRFYNDGDKFFEGYGTETAGPAHSFLVNSDQINRGEQRKFEALFDSVVGTYDDNEYEKMLLKLANLVMSYVEGIPEDQYQELGREMFDFEPEYEEEEEDDDDFYYDYDDDDEEDYMQEGKLNESPSSEELRMARQAVYRFMKYRQVEADEAIRDLINALEVLKRTGVKGRLSEKKEDINKILKAQKIIKKVLKDEGGAAGLKPIVAALKGLKIGKDELIKILKKTVGVVKHQHGDYIIKPIEEGTCGYDRDVKGKKLDGPGGLGERYTKPGLYRKKMKRPSGMVSYMDFTEHIYEKLTKKSDVGDFVDDFKKSDAKQFKGKSAKKKKEMAVAAYLAKQNEK